MKKIFIILGILLLGIISYAKEEDILGTWLIKENNFVFLEQNNDLTYSKERNSLAYFTLKFPDYEFSYHVWINIQKDGNLFLKGTGNTEVGKYVGEWHLIRENKKRFLIMKINV